MAEREDAAGYSRQAERNPRAGCPGGLGCAHGTHILFVFKYTSLGQKKQCAACTAALHFLNNQNNSEMIFFFRLFSELSAHGNILIYIIFEMLPRFLNIVSMERNGITDSKNCSNKHFVVFIVFDHCAISAIFDDMIHDFPPRPMSKILLLLVAS